MKSLREAIEANEPVIFDGNSPIVEAVNARGEVLSLPVTSEETGKTRVVDQWGIRVDAAVFERVARDKRDDGIIQQRRFGTKQSGRLKPDYRIPTSGAAITQW